MDIKRIPNTDVHRLLDVNGEELGRVEMHDVYLGSLNRKPYWVALNCGLDDRKFDSRAEAAAALLATLT